MKSTHFLKEERAINIQNILNKLAENKIKCNEIMGKWGNTNVLLTCELKSYLVEIQDNQYNLLEFNQSMNKKRKPKYHFLDVYENLDTMINYIKTRKFYRFN